MLEQLFDLPAAERTLATARGMLPAVWQGVLDEAPEAASLFAEDADGAEFAEWLARPRPCWATTSRWRTRPGSSRRRVRNSSRS